MRHIKLENNIPVNYTLEQLFVDVPDAVIYPLVTTPQPILNEDETTEEGIPEFKDNEWHQTWVVRKLSIDEIQEIIDSRQYVSADVVTGNSFLADSVIII